MSNLVKELYKCAIATFTLETVYNGKFPVSITNEERV